MARRLSFPAFCLCLLSFSLLNDPILCKTLKRDGIYSNITFCSTCFDCFSLCLFNGLNDFYFVVKALNEIKASLGWRVVYSWVGDDPCGDGDLPPWSGVTCTTQGDYRVVTKLYD